MNRFVWKLLFFTITATLIFIAYARVFIGGEDDNFYRRFTSPPAPSLVVGSSRCAQGVVPSVINESNLRFTRPLYNYCFTNGNSPYGPYYLESIRKKLSEGGHGLFLVEVNPWTLSVRRSHFSEDEFREAEQFIAEMEIVNYANPNLEYIFKRYNTAHYKTIYYDIFGIDSPTYLNENGWLRVDIDMGQNKIERRKKRKISVYRKFEEKWSFSKTRLDYLGDLLTYLSKHGRVVAIRMPISKEMCQVEESYMPDFDAKMDSIVQVSGGTYLDYSTESGGYQTTDGNHLWRKDARRFTRALIDTLR